MRILTGLLQGRPYEEDQVTGLLTVEFLFKDSAFPPSVQTDPANSLKLPASLHKPTGIMKTSPYNGQVQFDSLIQSDGDTQQNLTSVEYRKVGSNKAGYNPYSPYDSYNTNTTNTSQQSNLLAPPARTSSRPRQGAAEPEVLTAGTRDASCNDQSGILILGSFHK